MITLYYTIGNSDIVLDGKQRFSNFYINTKEIFNKLIPYYEDKLKFKNGIEIDSSFEINYNFSQKDKNITKRFKKIEFPIITALLDELCKNKRKPDKIYLFATEQVKQYPQDTIYTGKLIKLYIQKKYRISNVEIIKIQDNPSLFNKMLEYFSDFVNQKEEEISSNLYNIIQISAGTPQMYYSLAHNFMNKPGVLYYYIARENGKSTAYENKTFNSINKKNHLDIISSLLENFNYAGALNVVKKSPFRNDDILIKILNILTKKLNFNIDSEAFESARYVFEKEKNLFPDIYSEINGIYNKDKKYLFTEFYLQIEILFKINNYTGAVAMIFSFFDNIRQYLIEKLLDIKIDDVKNSISEKLNDSVTKIDGLRQKFENKENKVKIQVNTTNYEKIIEYFEENKNDNNCKIFREISKKFITDEFLEIRNKGPFAHGTKGISEEEISKIYGDGSNKMISDLKKLLGKLDLFVKNMTYKNYNAKIEEYIKQSI